MIQYITMREALLRDIEDLKRERDEAREQLRLANIDFFNTQAELEEQARLLAMSADREEKLRTDLMLARKLADSAMLEADRLRAQLHKQ